MNARSPALPIYLGVGVNSVFGLLHRPGSDSPSTLGVLICPPFGWEDICSYRSRRDWAEQLAAAGYWVLRIDLPGTGDSAGSPRDPDRLSAWSDAVSSAVRRLRAIPGCERVATVGIGLGGLVICAAIATGAPIDDVVLWAVPSRGRTLMRELRIFARLEDTALDAPAGHLPLSLPEGYTSVGGFVLSDETVQALEGFDVAVLPRAKTRATRALLLERDGLAVDARLRDHLAQSGVSVTIAPGPGYGAMMAKPHLARPPIDVFARVQSWLEEPTSSSARQESTVPVASAMQAEEQPEAISAGSIQLAVGSTAIQETPLKFEQPFGELFAILAEPVDAPLADLCVVMLNAAATRRIGPNRMWVEIARRWAARGVPTLRIDLAGIGDADGNADALKHDKGFYVPRYISQTREVMTALTARGLPTRFVLAGLCSGAYWAFHAALEDERVSGAFMVNPRALFWDHSLEVARDFRRGVLRPSSWRRIMRGEVPPARIGALLYQAPFTLPRRALMRRTARRADEDKIFHALDRLRETDKQLLFVFSDDEPLYEEFALDGLLDQLDRWPNISLDLIPGRDHTLRPFESQRSAHEALDRALQRELQRTAQSSVPRAPKYPV